MQTTLILGIIALIIVIFVITKYNWIITLRNNRVNAFADIDVQLQQRFDLVPNLVNTVKWYADHEKEIYDRITESRKAYAWATWVDAKIAAANELTWMLGRLFAIAENNPELKANQNFIQLQEELSDIENKLASVRRFFNSATKEYNTYIQLFPTNVIAWMFWFKEEMYFETESEEVKKSPKVEF